MTANIHAILAADLAATVFDADAVESPTVSISYTPAGGSATPIVAVPVVPEGGEIDFDGDRADAIERQTLAIPADAASGIATPDRGDTLVLDGETWGVDRVDSIVPGVVAVLEIHRQQQVRQGRRP